MSTTYLRVGCAAVKSRFNRSGALASEGSGTVVRTRRRSLIPAMPCSAITRATRLRLTRLPLGAPSLSSAVIRGAP
jgi:hypothetical protein